MKKFLMMIALVFAFCMSACDGVKSEKVAYDISGTWEESVGDTVFVLGEDTAGNEMFLDTILTDKGRHFTCKGMLDFPQRLQLYFVKKGGSDSLSTNSVDVFADGTPIVVNVKAAQTLFGDYDISVKGSRQQVSLDRLRLFQLFQMMCDIAKGDPAVEKEMKTFEKEMFQFVDSTRNDVASTYILSDYLSIYYPLDTLTKYYDNLSGEVKKSVQGCNLSRRIQTMRNVQKGNKAPDFKIAYIDGGSFSLSSLRGSYVVLDFWASWCAPCRAEIPNLKDIYAKHKADGLKMVSVSLDKDEAKWKMAVKDEGMDWTQVSSLEGFNCPSAKAFGVNSIPAIFIIGKDGSILEGGLRGKELADAVDRLF